MRWRKLLLPLMALLVMLIPPTPKAEVQIQRLDGNPIIHPTLSATLGDNIDGPSLIRVPTWLPNPLGRYYLYFAAHSGSYIRMAYADRLEGPWTVYEPGTLSAADIPQIYNQRAAAPDVHIDEANRRIVMYFYGYPRDEDRPTLTPYPSYVAESSDGIEFTAASAERVGSYFFRMFPHGGLYYGVAKQGPLFRSPSLTSGFVAGDSHRVFENPALAGNPWLFTNGHRHFAVKADGNVGYVFFSLIGDAPERIKVVSLDLSDSWENWITSRPQEVIRPEKTYEGANLPIEPSVPGKALGPVNQLRDPAVFEEDGRTYVLYSIAGESGIGIAEIVSLSPSAIGTCQQDDGGDALLSIEAEYPSERIGAGNHMWHQSGRYNPEFTPSQVMEVLPDMGDRIESDYAALSPRLSFSANFTRSGRHYLWVRGLAPNQTSGSVHAGLNGNESAGARSVTLGSVETAVWSNSGQAGSKAYVDIPSTGEHRLDLWMDQDGTVIDKFVLTPNPDYVPSGSGPAESPCGDNIVATPTINPDGGSYTESVEITLTTTPSDAVIYYTLDGSVPDETDTQYTGPLTLTSSANVTGRAFLGGWAESEPASASFTITPAGGGGGSNVYQQAADGLVSIELENHNNTTSASGHSWDGVSQSGASGTAVQSLPNNSTNINSGYTSSSPRMDYPVNFTRSGVHYVWIRGQGPSNKDDSLHVGLNGAAVSTADRITYFTTAWTWSKGTMDGAVAQINIPSAGVHTINVWMREDGMIGDKLVLTPSAGYTPTGTGPAESPIQ